MSPVRRSANERSSPRPATRRPLRAPAAVDQPVLGDRGERDRRADEAVAEVGLGEHEPAVLRLPARPQPLQVVGGALALAALRPRDERRVARARELLELRLGLVERAGGELGRLRAELERLRARDRGQPQRLARLERRRDRGRRDVEVVRVGVVEGGAHVLPVVAQRRLDVLVGGDHDVGVVGEEVEQLAEAVDRQQLGDVRAAARRPRARRSRPARGARRRARRRARSRPAAPPPASAG